MKTMTSDEADDRGDEAGADRIRAEARADGALLDRNELRRQGARAQHDREIGRLFDREVAGNLAGAAEDRLVDARMRSDDLPSRMMAKGLPTLSAVSLPKRSAPFWLNRKLTIGSLF